MIRFSATSCSIDRYLVTAFFGFPKAFMTALDLSSSFGRANLADAAGGLVGECGDGSPSIRPRDSGGEAQKLSLPQLLVVDVVDAVFGVAGTLGVFGVLGVAGIIGLAGRERTDVIEQSLDVDILATNALDDVGRAWRTPRKLSRSACRASSLATMVADKSMVILARWLCCLGLSMRLETSLTFVGIDCFVVLLSS
jgi:hypothetical protein